MKAKNQVLLISICILICIITTFWLSSRFPALDTKAELGDENVLSGISFDPIKLINDSDLLYSRIYKSSINWYKTNLHGMTFGLLFAAALMLVFSLIKEKSFKSHFGNSVFGSIVGAPLGVCVNCAAPIAQGFYYSGGRAESAISMMMSSPTFNFVVISMMFALLPIHLVLIKIILSILFIVLVVPFTVKLIGVNKVKNNSVYDLNKTDTFTSLFSIEIPEEKNWFLLLFFTLKLYFKFLFYIVKKALPLMILAGFLGAIAVEFIPLDSIPDLEKSLSSSVLKMALLIIITAFLGTFLPVPIAFEVILASLLINVGVSIYLVGILFFTLSIFSIYPFFIVGKSISWKISSYIFFLTAFFGIIAGIVTHYSTNYLTKEYFNKNLINISTTPPTAFLFDTIPVAEYSSNQALLIIKKNKLENKTKLFDNNEVIIEYQNIITEQSNLNKFTRSKAFDLGINEPMVIKPDFIQNSISLHNRAICSEDVNNDGLIDLLIITQGELTLYYNNNATFLKVPLSNELSLDKLRCFNSSLIDFNNDGKLDLFISLYNNGNRVYINNNGKFELNNYIVLPALPNMTVTMAPSFADLNNDGIVDVFLGNWSFGFGIKQFNYKGSQNALLLSEGLLKYKVITLDETIAETLTSIIADINNDGNLDIIAGNDFKPSDHYYLGNGKGKFKLITAKDSLIKETTNTTMSINVNDINNDGINDLYLAQIEKHSKINYEQENYTHYINNITKKEKKQYELFSNWLILLYSKVENGNYYYTKNNKYQNDVLGLTLINKIRELNNTGKFDKANGLKKYLTNYYTNAIDYLNVKPDLIKKEKNSKANKEQIKQNQDHNICYIYNPSKNKYIEQSGILKIQKGGWSWNTQFIDVDNDEWKDLHIVNGYYLNTGRNPHFLYKNLNGKKFIEKAKELNLNSFIPTQVSSHLDFDNDGDIDIICLPEVGSPMIYVNHNKNNFIDIVVKDKNGSPLIGGKIIIYYNNQKSIQSYNLNAGGGFRSFNPYIAHFGLSKHKLIDKVVIIRGDNTKTTIDKKLIANKKYTINLKN